jgi:hypothetical protein
MTLINVAALSSINNLFLVPYIKTIGGYDFVDMYH